MIHTEQLVKHYGQVHALDGLDLHVESGVIYGFLGPNGAGKTTTMRILSGLVRADRGKAYIDQRQIRMHDADQHRSIGVLPEEPAFYNWMTAREYLRDFVAPLYKIKTDLANRWTEETLEQVGLGAAANRRIGGFSRGMRQRLGLAQALVHKPQVLLLDEPVSALDPAGRKDVLEIIDNLRGEVTVLLSTHILADVERVCDMIGIIDKGRMIVEDHRQSLLSRYATHTIEVDSAEKMDNWLDVVERQSFVEQVVRNNQSARLLVNHVGDAQRELLQSLANEGIPVRRFEVVRPSLEDVFSRLTTGREETEEKPWESSDD